MELKYEKNVTMISSLPPIVGLSFYTKELVEALSKKIKVHFLGFNHIYPSALYPGKIRDESLIPLEPHENLEIRNTLDWFNPFGWIAEAFRIKTKIVHAQWWSFPLAPIYITILGICKLRGKKIIMTAHNILPHEKNPIKTFLNKSVLFLADVFIVHTAKNKEDLAKITPRKPVYIIPHGIIKAPERGISRDRARQEMGIALNDKILLCFGHIRPYKGLDIAIKALAQINDASVKLLIAGKCWEDWTRYEKLISENNLQERVILKLDFIRNDETEIYFKAADLVLLPYKYFDAQSGVGALAMTFHVPMIVSKTGGLTDYVSREECIAEPDKPDDLANKIKHILSQDHLYRVLQEDLIQKEQALSWDSISLKLSDVYKTFF